MSRIEEQVIDFLRSRSETGKRKYGVTMERDDLNFLQWLQHLQEELLDAAVYVEKLKEEVKSYEQDTRTSKSNKEV
jgi:hypothetical protein